MNKDYIFINGIKLDYIRWYYDSKYRRVKVYERLQKVKKK